MTAILTYHVVGQAADSQVVATLDGQIMENEATVASAGLIADSGIVHAINGVLLPPDIAASLGEAAAPEAPMEPTIAETVVALAGGDPVEFTILLAALETADLVDALNNPQDELTVFVSTDAAFGSTLEALGLTAEDLLASEDLASILTHRVTAEGLFDAATVIAAAPIVGLPTLNADTTLKVGVFDGSVVINDGAEPLGGATVGQADVFASSEAIHVMDTVLLP